MWKLLVATSVAMATAPMALAYAATDENEAAIVDVRVSAVVEKTAKDLREEGKRQLRAAAARAERRERAKEARRKAERRAAARARAKRREEQAAKARVQAVSPALEAIAACESGGNPGAIGGGGTYRGKYQFDYGTWGSVGGDGDPAAASETEQDRRAALLYKRAGATPWPVCGNS